MVKKLLWIPMLWLAVPVTLAPAAVAGAAAGLAGRAAPADVIFNVASPLDAVDDNPGDGVCHTAPDGPALGACTLRAATMEANASLGPAVTILVPAGTYTLTIAPAGADDDSSGDLNLTTPAGPSVYITINGAGADSTIINANQIDRVLTVNAGRHATLRGLTLRGGVAQDALLSGGGVADKGTLFLDHTSINNNFAAAIGGGVYAPGSLNVTDSTIGPNNSASDGGGVYSAGSLTLDRSTVYGNGANFGAGIDNDGASLTMINSTLSQNAANSNGGNCGAIFNSGQASVYNSTILYNSADTDPNVSSAAGGVCSSVLGRFNLYDSLLAGNYHANDSSAANCVGTIHSYVWNLFETDNPCSDPVVIEEGGWATLNSLSFIGPLQDNGGPTWTHALLNGSDAINSGDPVNGCMANGGPLTTDQRGTLRPVGALCDIGAFEYVPPLYIPLLRR